MAGKDAIYMKVIGDEERHIEQIAERYSKDMIAAGIQPWTYKADGSLSPNISGVIRFALQYLATSANPGK